MNRTISSVSRLSRRQKYLVSIWQARYLYLLVLPGLISIIIFNYGPMYGLQLAFKDFNAGLGIYQSPWIGLTHFQRLLNTPDFINAFYNTIIISFGRLLYEFPFPILLGILLSEMRFTGMKRVLQTIYTFPHFLSWVIISGILITFLDSVGPINAIIAAFGGERINILANTNTFRGILYGTSIWKSAGWSSIIYMAAIINIDHSYTKLPQLMEPPGCDKSGT